MIIFKKIYIICQHCYWVILDIIISQEIRGGKENHKGGKKRINERVKYNTKVGDDQDLRYHSLVALIRG